MQTAASVPLSAMGAGALAPSGSTGSLQKAVTKFSGWRAGSISGTAPVARSMGGNSLPGSPPSPSSLPPAFPGHTTLTLRRVRSTSILVRRDAQMQDNSHNMSWLIALSFRAQSCKLVRVDWVRITSKASCGAF